MKKIYYVNTNGNDFVATHDDDGIVRVLDNICELVDQFTTYNEYNEPITDYSKMLDAVEDDSSWEMHEDITDFEAWLGVDANEPDAPQVVVERNFD